MATCNIAQRSWIGLLDSLSKASDCTDWPKAIVNSYHCSKGERQRIFLPSIYNKDLYLTAYVSCNDFRKRYFNVPLLKTQVKCFRQGCTASFETAMTRKWPKRSNFSGQLHFGHAKFTAVNRVDNLQVKAAQQDALKQVTGFVHLAVSLGLLLALDKFLKRAFAEASIRFPSALFGMFCLFSLLMILDSISPASANQIVALFTPANSFIQRWLPLFYVPSLVVVPLAVKGIPPSAGLIIAVILVGGWAVSLGVAGYTAVMVRKIVRKELLSGEPVPKSSPFTRAEFVVWTIVMGLAFALAVLLPTAFGTTSLTALPFLLASTIVGYIFGSRLPDGAKKVLHPIITCSLTADLAAFILGLATGSGFEHTLGLYLTKNLNNPGAGDFLMGFLGTVILSFAFSMFRQRKLVQRHSAEIFSSIITSSMFSLYATAIVGRLLGLDPMLTRAIIPRCVTVALALPIAGLLEAQNTSLTAAVVVLTGLVGANFTQTWMDKLGLDDPIARGIATAASAHGLGTAALSAKEPEALPFCAIAYALTGIFCSVICSVPIVRQSLILLAG